MGLIEKYGSGIQRIIEYFEEANLPQPKFRNISEGFMVTIFSEELTDKVPDKVPDNLTENQYKILELVSKNNTISMSAIADSIGISKRKVLDNINKLKSLGLINRVGPAKGGYWKLINR